MGYVQWPSEDERRSLLPAVPSWLKELVAEAQVASCVTKKKLGNEGHSREQEEFLLRYQIQKVCRLSEQPGTYLSNLAED